MAEDDSDPVCLGGFAEEKQLPSGPVPAYPLKTRSQEAIGAVAASMPTAAYNMLKDGTLYQELGPNHFDNRAKGKHVLRLVNRLQNLGFDVHITPLAA